MYALGGFCRAEAGGQQSLSENSLGGGPVVPCYYATPLHCITLQLHYKSFGQLRHYMYIIIQKKARTVIFLSYYESQAVINTLQCTIYFWRAINITGHAGHTFQKTIGQYTAITTINILGSY